MLLKSRSDKKSEINLLNSIKKKSKIKKCSVFIKKHLIKINFFLFPELLRKIKNTVIQKNF